MGRGRPIQARPIDMGLPSGVQWANCNVGAESLFDEGLFFSWGNIEGHAKGEGYDFSQSVYDTTPGAAIETDLSLEQDAARAYLGAPWRMPSSDEFQELIANCTIVWTTVNGVYGRLFTSNVNGNTIFFPAAGQYNNTSLVNRGSGGYIWSSKFYSDAYALILSFNSSDIFPQNVGNRYYGLSVRAVLQPT